MLGSFDVSGADAAHYRSEELESSVDIGEIVEAVCHIEFDRLKRLHGIKVFYEVHADHGTELGQHAGLHKLIWQVSARDSYWYPGPHNERHTQQMPPGIFDQTKQSITVRPVSDQPGVGAESSEVEKFIDPTVLSQVPATFEPGDRLSVHVRISEDSAVAADAVIARATLIAYTSSIEG